MENQAMGYKEKILTGVDRESVLAIIENVLSQTSNVWEHRWNGETIEIELKKQCFYDSNTSPWFELGTVIEDLEVRLSYLGCEMNITPFPTTVGVRIDLRKGVARAHPFAVDSREGGSGQFGEDPGSWLSYAEEPGFGLSLRLRGDQWEGNVGGNGVDPLSWISRGKVIHRVELLARMTGWTIHRKGAEVEKYNFSLKKTHGRFRGPSSSSDAGPSVGGSRPLFPHAGMILGVVRELALRNNFPREPEPDLVMEGPEEVEAFRQAGRVDGIMAANYIYQTARVSQTIQGCRTVLDLGCGPATQLAQIASLHTGTRFIGVELSDEMIQEARAHVAQLGLKNVEIIKQDMTDLKDIPDGSVDGVVSTLALHHLPTLEHLDKTFREIKRVLQPGGAVYLTDFGRLKSKDTARFMAYRDADIQPPIFSRDYERSLRAAFLKEEFSALANKHLPGHVDVKSTFLVPLVVAVKTPNRPVPMKTIQRIKSLANALPQRFKRGLAEMRIFFRWGGLGRDLFGKLSEDMVETVPTVLRTAPSRQDEAAPTFEQVEAMVDAARWAPSGDNTQPFDYVWDGRVLTVQEDSARSGAFLDVARVPTRISLGMVLANLKIAAQELGWGPRLLEENPSSGVRVTFEPVPPKIHPLKKAILARGVDRRPYAPQFLSREYVHRLTQSMANPWGITFRLLHGTESVTTQARLQGEFETFLFGHKKAHDGFYRWLRRSPRCSTQDGLPMDTLALAIKDVLGLKLFSFWPVSRVASLIGLTGLARRRAQKVYENSSAFGLFSVRKNHLEDALRIGQLWQELWLQLTLDGWVLQPLFGGPMMSLLSRRGGIELTESQRALWTRWDGDTRRHAGVKKDEEILCVFRMGRPLSSPFPRSPRRELDEILSDSSPTAPGNELNSQTPISGFLQASLSGTPSNKRETTQTSREFDYATAFSRNIGLISDVEQSRLREVCVALPGMGGVGGVHLTCLTRMGIGRFRIADFDSFEIHNTNRQAGATVDTMGLAKVDVMAREALKINPGLRVETFPEGVHAGNIDKFLDGVDVVVDGLDFFALEARERLYDAAEKRGIPLITAGPMGAGTGWLVFRPGSMGWRKYFRLDLGKTKEEKLLLFALGLTPRAAQVPYTDSRSIDLTAGRGPSLSPSVNLCAGVVAVEILKIVLNRGEVKAAPYFRQFDVYRNLFFQGRLRWGNAGPIQRLKKFFLTKWLLTRVNR